VKGKSCQADTEKTQRRGLRHWRRRPELARKTNAVVVIVAVGVEAEAENAIGGSIVFSSPALAREDYPKMLH